MRLFLILLAVPILEIYLFLQVGEQIGTWYTIGLVILTALIGSFLLRQQGMAAMRDFQGRLASGETPGRLLADGAMILIAGALLLTPGFFTDAVGFALLVPPVRAAIWGWASSHVTAATAQQGGSATWHFQTGTTGRASGDGTTVDGTYQEVSDPANSAGEPGSSTQIDPPSR